MLLENILFTEVHDLFIGEMRDRKPIHDLLINTIDRLIEDKEKHTHGFDFYIETAFINLKEVLPTDVVLDQFKSLFNRCYMAKKSGLYSDVADTEFSKLEKEHFKEEFEMLGDAASDITGTGYLKLPVAVADMKPLRHYHP